MIEKIIKTSLLTTKKYKIDENGNIFSFLSNKYLKPSEDKDGYLRVSLSGDFKTLYFRVNVLVALIFIGEPPKEIEDCTVNHIDENKKNNHYSNLEYMERRKNSSIRTNTARGERNARSVLSEKEVRKICSLLEIGTPSISKIAKKFNVGKSTISNIRRRIKWSYISRDFQWEKFEYGSST